MLSHLNTLSPSRRKVMEEASNQGSALNEQMVPATPEDNSVQESVQQTVQDTAHASEVQQERNWVKNLRRDRDEAIRKAKMQEELIKQLMSNQHSQTQQQAPQEDILQELEREEYASGSKLAKVLKAQEERFQKKLQEFERGAQEQKKSEIGSQLRREYSDFDNVVNPESIEILQEMYPGRAQAIASISDPYEAALLAYETIKSKGIPDQLTSTRRTKEVDKKLEQNKKTVQSPQSFSSRPLAQAFQEPKTKEEKSAVYQEMLKYAGMSGGGY